jgi:hypothetical protein
MMQWNGQLQSRVRRQIVREFCVTLLCFTVLYGANFNGRHAASC